MLTVMPVEASDLLEELVAVEAPVRVIGTPLHAGTPVLEPRIRPWLGWYAEHAFRWDHPGKVTATGLRLEIDGQDGFTWFAGPFRCVTRRDDSSLTLIASMAPPR